MEPTGASSLVEEDVIVGIVSQVLKLMSSWECLFKLLISANSDAWIIVQSL